MGEKQGPAAPPAGLREALVEAVLPLEVIAAQDRAKPYAELSRDLIADINAAISTVHQVLDAAQPADPWAEADEFDRQHPEAAPPAGLRESAITPGPVGASGVLWTVTHEDVIAVMRGALVDRQAEVAIKMTPDEAQRVGALHAAPSCGHPLDAERLARAIHNNPFPEYCFHDFSGKGFAGAERDCVAITRDKIMPAAYDGEGE